MRELDASAQEALRPLHPRAIEDVGRDALLDDLRALDQTVFINTVPVVQDAARRLADAFADYVTEEKPILARRADLEALRASERGRGDRCAGTSCVPSPVRAGSR